MYLNIWGFDNDRKVIAEKMWRSFENFENSRDNSSRSGKGGGGLEIWNKILDTGYSKIEKSTERLGGSIPGGKEARK